MHAFLVQNTRNLNEQMRVFAKAFFALLHCKSWTGTLSELIHFSQCATWFSCACLPQIFLHALLVNEAWTISWVCDGLVRAIGVDFGRLMNNSSVKDWLVIFLTLCIQTYVASLALKGYRHKFILMGLHYFTSAEYLTDNVGTAQVTKWIMIEYAAKVVISQSITPVIE